MAIGFGAGVQRARRAAAVRLDRDITQALMAQLVTKELDRMGVKRPNGEALTVSQSTWSDYEAERSEPSFAVIRATAQVSGLSEAEIAFPEPLDALDPSPRLCYPTDEGMGRAAMKVAEPPKLPLRPVNPAVEGAGRASPKRAKGK